MPDEALPTAIDLRVVTPERPVISEQTTSVSLPGKGGRLGILPGHAPLVSELANGVLFFDHGEQTKYMAVHGGFAEVLQGRVTVLAQLVEKAEDIDVARAERAKQQAEEQLRQHPSGEEAESQRAAIERSVARIEAARLRS
ncbi:MAG: F0F1 ATP synthase subunit epsilon [Terriglobia bacterium]